MKKHIIILVVLFAVGGFLLWWFFSRISSFSATKPSGQGVDVDGGAATVSSTSLPMSRVVVTTNDFGIDMERPSKVTPAMWARCLGYFNWGKANNAPIDFYGKIIDQHSNAVAGVRVDAEISTFIESLRVQMDKSRGGGDQCESTRFYPTTDADGCFSITGEKGLVLYIHAIKKDGYEVSGREPRSFTYGKHYGGLHIPDPKQPVLFKIWEKGKTEPLIKNKVGFKTKMDRSVYSVSLVSGKGFKGTNQTCDVFVEMWMDSSTQSSTPSWSVAFSVPTGGFVVTDDRYLYSAPEDGYQSRWEWDVRSDNPKWGDLIHRKFYIKSRSGKVFASTEVEVYEYHDGSGAVYLSNLVNPNGSRNLEYDPKKEIEGAAKDKLIKELDGDVTTPAIN